MAVQYLSTDGNMVFVIERQCGEIDIVMSTPFSLTANRIKVSDLDELIPRMQEIVKKKKEQRELVSVNKKTAGRPRKESEEQ